MPRLPIFAAHFEAYRDLKKLSPADPAGLAACWKAVELLERDGFRDVRDLKPEAIEKALKELNESRTDGITVFYAERFVGIVGNNTSINIGPHETELRIRLKAGDLGHWLDTFRVTRTKSHAGEDVAVFDWA